jgi:quercetin dioxygenase-like cupin family protein
MEFVLGDTPHRVDAGSFVFVPRGVTHTVANPAPAGRASW